MPKKPFSQSTKAKIRRRCQYRCVICVRRLGETGRCAHILDSSNAGANMVKFAAKVGVLNADYSRSAVENGVLLCSSCHRDLFTPNLVVLSPPCQVLQYLIDYIRSGNPKPIHEVLDQLLLSQESHIGLPDPRSILPYLGLYTLVPLAPERLINVNFLVFSEAELSEIHNGRWTVVPPGRTPSSSTTARIHDTTALRLTDRADSSPKIDLSTTARPEQRYWRLPTRIAPMLAALLDRVAFLANSDCEEIKLAIRLRNLLLIAPHNLEKSSSLVGGSSSNSPGDQGRNMSGGGKREHKGDDRESCKRGRNNQCQSGAKTGASAVGHQHKDGHSA